MRAIDKFLQGADLIGSDICAEAIRADGRCNWFGDRQRPDAGSRRRLETVSLDAGLYSGTAGVGWFLAELAAATGESIHAETAREALNQSLYLTRQDASLSAGFYSGSMGIIWALREAARALDSGALLGEAARLLGRLRRLKPKASNPDLMAGGAGEIPVLVQWAGELGDEELADWAADIGDDLISCAERSDRGWSWSTIGGQSLNLLGLAHGVSGFALAFLYLFAATGEERFAAAAKEAMRYEQSWHQPEAGNWPDLRGVSMNTTPQSEDLSFMCAWCHGAAGIALTRFVATKVLGALNETKSDLDVGMASTERSLDEFLEHGCGNLSLCHGVGGNADILLTIGRDLGRNEWIEKAFDVGSRAMECFGGSRPAWPCGLHSGGHTPNLMIGTAGVGAFLLRLGNASRTHSALLPGGLPCTRSQSW